MIPGMMSRTRSPKQGHAWAGAIAVGYLCSPVAAFLAPSGLRGTATRAGTLMAPAAVAPMTPRSPAHTATGKHLRNVWRMVAAEPQASLVSAASTPGAPLRIGMFGGGTVGGGVYDICENQKKKFFEDLGCHADIVKICVKDAAKPRDFPMGAHTELVTDFDAILGDDSINCVVELMGGTTAAKDVVFGAIKAGKHVVTANKALVAQYLPEIQALLQEHPGVSFGYEAAVCGGIPIIRTLQNDYLGDKVKKICGIMNGTTNFMLSKMESEGANYDKVLKEAQDLGFAEADPTADVEGHDVQAKIALLAKLAYGATVPAEAVPCQGITQIDKVDFEYAKMMRSTIKLLGTAMVSPGGDKLSVFVSPVVVPNRHPIASARGPGNIVSIESQNMGTTSYSGPGAGRYPTANSVVNDVVRLGVGQPGTPFPYDKEWAVEEDYTAGFYTRITCKDELGIIKKVGELAADNGVSIHAILQNPIEDPTNVDFVVTTDPCRLSQIEAFCGTIEKETWAKQAPLCLPLL